MVTNIGRWQLPSKPHWAVGQQTRPDAAPPLGLGHHEQARLWWASGVGLMLHVHVCAHSGPVIDA
jgi:hypothetical protein